MLGVGGCRRMFEDEGGCRRMPMLTLRADALPPDTSAQASVPLDAQALQTPNAEKCLTEQHTYSKHRLIHVLKSHLQAYFHSLDINHCKYVLINKAIQTDCLFHPYHMQVTGQHPEEKLFPAHLSLPLAAATTGSLGKSNGKPISGDMLSPKGLVVQNKAAESSTAALRMTWCRWVAVLPVTSVPSAPHLCHSVPPNTHRAGMGMPQQGRSISQHPGFPRAAACLYGYREQEHHFISFFSPRGLIDASNAWSLRNSCSRPVDFEAFTNQTSSA